MKKSLLLFLLNTCISFTAFTQESGRFWHWTENIPVGVGKPRLTPETYRTIECSLADFYVQQNQIPEWGSTNTYWLSLPTPDGQEIHLRVYRSSIMDPSLASRYPEIQTFTGLSDTHPFLLAKLDITPHGFHAMVLHGAQTYFIDPINETRTDMCLVYYKKDFRKAAYQIMACELTDEAEHIHDAPAVDLSANGLPTLSSYKTNGDTLRNYRLALACTEEYAAAVGGATPTKASVLAAMVTSMNRVNGVFEKEFSMKATLVANNDTLIFLPGSGDPYTNASGSTMLGQNQTTVNARIGSANYDFGHVFSTGGGGIASLGSVCNSSTKAQGVTGSSNPVGDPFDIDYVAHEMGHQFGGSHTFNSVTGSCSGNRSSNNAYEIGSGTTIMAYAGICGTDNIQPHSDDYYHVRSLEQMTGNSVKACASITMSGNTPPVLNPINATYIIPYRTPFELTATATDANGDPLTFCWEQYNRGGSGSAWNAPTTVAPILRSFQPDASGTRVFPAYEELIQNTESYLGERLPDTARILRFRCTVRDFHNGNGAFFTSTDTLRLDVRSTLGKGLFRITSQNTSGQSWQGWNAQTITWNTAGTETAPVSSPLVDIYVSIDSGKTWPFLVASGTANDGSEVIYAPNESTKWARVKVKAKNNVFFDLNDEWIEIKKTSAPAGIQEIDNLVLQVYPNPVEDVLQVTSRVHFQDAILTLFNVFGTPVWNAGFNGNEISISCADFAPGVYTLRLQSKQGHSSQKLVIR